MLIVFTSLDHGLLNQNEKDYGLITPIIEKLTTQNIPLIPVTSKTRAEVEIIRQELGLSTPFIVENGSAIFISQSDRLWQTDDATLESEYYVKTFGCNYIEARAGLKIIQSTLRINNLKGFGDFEDIELQSVAGLPKQQAKKAKTREFSEPFIPPKNISTNELAAAANDLGFKIIFGDRFFYILGNNVDQGTAIRWLIDNYISQNQALTTVCLGNSSQDLAMLEQVDIPVIIPTETGMDSSLANKNWKTANAPNIQGWVEVITEICQL